jgi:hypothetical protein
MPMPPYRVVCYRSGCSETAGYKIAARWSDGLTRELKTYALSCQGCLAEQFACARVKQSACRLASGETLDVPEIYELARGKRDAQLVRRTDLEEQFLGNRTPA